MSARKEGEERGFCYGGVETPPFRERGRLRERGVVSVTDHVWSLEEIVDLLNRNASIAA